MDRYLPVGHAARDYDQSGHIYIMSGFFEELQRRKVYRVAAAYIVAAGFLIQIADLSETRQDFFLDAIGEISIIRIAA